MSRTGKAVLLGALCCLCASSAALAEAGNGEWVMAGRDFANTRYSPLDQITRDNVKSLVAVFSFSTGVLRGHEGAPLVAGSTMYIVTPYPNIVYALDLSKPDAPAKWKYEPNPSASAQGVACCDVVNRGAAYADGRIYFNTLDSHTIALDADTGKEIWRARLGDIGRGETMTMAPLVAKNRVLVGNSGGEYGVRGWIAALDARNGNIVWRAFSTGPDKDVLIGTHFQPFYAQDRGKDLGISTWPGEAWKIGGGAVWGFLSYDPELDLVFYGTSNPSPWNPEQRPGDNKWTAGVFARELSTGEARWFYQMSPHDLHDYDGINENVLVEIALQGRTRKVIVHPDRNGYLYVFDRITGQVLTATPYAYITTSTGVDSGSGRLRYSASKQPREGTVIHELCPASPGAKDWQPSAYSPRTGWLYMPQNNLCQDAETDRTSYIRGTPFVGATLKMYPGPGGHRGEFNAWDPATGKQMWSVR